MLTKEELHSIKKMMLMVLPSQGRPMRALVPELQAWQQAIAAVDRELKALDAPAGVAES